jgi:hypothetical protein
VQLPVCSCASCVIVLTCYAVSPVVFSLCPQNMFEDWLSHQVGMPAVAVTIIYLDMYVVCGLLFSKSCACRRLTNMVKYA